MNSNLQLNPIIECIEIDGEIILKNNNVQSIYVANKTMSDIVKYIAHKQVNIIQLKSHFFSLYPSISDDILTKDFNNALQLMEHNNVIEYI